MAQDNKIPKTEEEKRYALRLKYRETFQTDDDLIVLFDILNECGEWETFDARGLSAEEFRARQMVGRHIQFMLGGRQQINAIGFLRATLELPYVKEQK